MAKKIAIFLVEFVYILLLGIILIIAFTGGFSFEIGSLAVKLTT